MRLKNLFVGVFASAACAASADPIQPAENAAATTAAIQSAIDVAANLAEPGTVTLGSGLFEIDAQLMVTGGVTLVGQGWNNTIIKQTVETYVSDNALATRVVTVSGGAKVEHVTLTGGRVVGANYQFGGGAYVDGGTVSWCCITNNSVVGANVKFGGGVGFNQGSGGTVDHCIIADNLVKTTTGEEIGGGGVGAYLPYGAIIIDSCLISRNRSVVIYEKDGVQGPGKGGGIGIDFVYRNDSVTVRNTTIAGNVAGEGEAVSMGGGVYTSADTNHKLTMINCIIAANTSTGTNTAVAAEYAGGIDYCLFDIEADLAGGHSFNGNPRFVDSENDDYRLELASPAVGNGETYTGIGNDLNDAVFSDPPSMGCYEYGELAAKPAISVVEGADGTISVTVTCDTDGAVLYYTEDGSRPTNQSTPYTGPIEVCAGTTIRVRAYAPDIGPSAIVTTTVGGDSVAAEPISISLDGAVVKIGVSKVQAGCWYALKKTTDLSEPFVVVEDTWMKGSDLISGTGELSVALDAGESQAFYRIEVSSVDPRGI